MRAQKGDLDVADPENGFAVLSAIENSPAAELGIEIDDVVVTVNQLAVNEANLELILVEFQSLGLGDSLALTVKQNTVLSHLTMTVDENKLPSVDLHIEPDDYEKPLPVVELSTTSSPRIQSGYDAGQDFSQFETYNFIDPTKIKDVDSSELLTLQFGAAIEQQMLKRGYLRTDSPDILINVSIDLNHKTRAPITRTFPGVLVQDRSEQCPSYDDYNGSRFVRRIRSSAGSLRTLCEFQEGSVSVDLIDAEKRHAIWSGILSVRIAKDEMRLNSTNQRTLFPSMVNDAIIMFENFPVSVQ